MDIRKSQSYKYMGSDNGFVLAFAVFVSAILLAIGLALFSNTLRELMISSGSRESQVAFYAADAAAECALYWDLRYPGFERSVFGGQIDVTKSIAMVCGDSNCSDHDQDTDAKEYVEEELGYEIDKYNDDNQSWDPTEYDVVLISASVNSSKIGWLKDKQVGILTMEGHGYDELGLADNGNGSYTPDDDVNIRVDSHYITQGYSNGEEVDIASGDDLGYMEYWGNDVTLLAEYKTQGSGSDERAWLLAIDAGEILEDGSTAAERRVFVGAGEFGDLNSNGEAIFARAIDWAAHFENSIQGFVYPVDQESSVICNSVDITSPSTGWDSGNGWDISDQTDSTVTTTFDMSLDNGSCATVQVFKDGADTRIDARGFNTCVLTNPRRVERGLRVTY